MLPSTALSGADIGILTIGYPTHTGAATNRLITAKDHASVQINVAEVDESGRMINGKNVSYAFSGYVRQMGESDDSLNMLATNDGRECTAVWSFWPDLTSRCPRSPEEHLVVPEVEEGSVARLCSSKRASCTCRARNSFLVPTMPA